MPLKLFSPGVLRRLALASNANATQVLDANNDGVGAVLIAPKAGTIDRIGMYLTAVTGVPPTYRLGIEGVTSTRQPDNVYLASGGAYVDKGGIAFSPGWAWSTLGSPVTVAAGDKIAATARYQSGTVNASNCVTCGYGFSSTQPSANARPYSLTLTGGTWAAVRVLPIMAVRYTDGTVVGIPIASTATVESWNSGSNPLHLGNLWTPSARCRLVGAQLCIRPQASSDFDVRVYLGGSSSPAAQASIDADVDWAGVSVTDPGEIVLPPLTLRPGVPVRLVVTPTTANSITQFIRINTPDADSCAAWVGELRGTTAQTAGTWTDYTNRIYPIVPLIDQVDVRPGHLIGG